MQESWKSYLIYRKVKRNQGPGVIFLQPSFQTNVSKQWKVCIYTFFSTELQLSVLQPWLPVSSSLSLLTWSEHNSKKKNSCYTLCVKLNSITQAIIMPFSLWLESFKFGYTCNYDKIYTIYIFLMLVFNYQ